MSAPVLVFGWGNPARGDDGLGPAFVEVVEGWGLPGVECLTDFQLQVEHAMDLVGRERVLFVDASASAQAPYELSVLAAARDASFTTHELSPGAVLHVCADVVGAAPPPTWLLGIRGEQWGLGEPMSSAGERHLAAALAWARAWLAPANLGPSSTPSPVATG